VIGVADAAQIVWIKKGEAISAALCDVDFRSNPVIDLSRGGESFADDTDLAQRIAGEDERNRLLAPGMAVVEFLEPALTTFPTRLQ
jgi:hypothetical protein